MTDKIYSAINIYCNEKNICISNQMNEMVYDDVDFILLIAIIEEEIGEELNSIGDLCSTSFEELDDFIEHISNLFLVD